MQPFRRPSRGRWGCAWSRPSNHDWQCRTCAWERCSWRSGEIPGSPRQSGIEATEATMTSVDRLGFSLRLKTTDGVKGARINFLHEVVTPQDTRAVLVEMARQAKTRS